MDQVLTLKEVARYAEMHEVTVQRWCRTAGLPAIRIGGAHRIKETALDDGWTERSPAPTSGNPCPRQ